MEFLDYVEEELDINESIIPDHCTSFNEMMSYVNEYVDSIYSEMYKSIAENEISAFESDNSLVVYEADELSDKYKNMMVEIASAYKTFWIKVIDEFKSIRENNNKNIKINKSYIKSLSGDKVFGKIIDYNFDKIRIEYNIKTLDYMKKCDSIYKKYGSKEDINFIKSQLDSNLYSYISGQKCSNESSMKKAIKNQALGGNNIEVTGSWIKKNYKVKLSRALNDVNEGMFGFIYGTIMSVCNKATSYVQNIEKGQDQISIYLCKSIIDAIKTMNNAFACWVDIYRKVTREYANILTKVAVKDVNESTDEIVDKPECEGKSDPTDSNGELK